MANAELQPTGPNESPESVEQGWLSMLELLYDSSAAPTPEKVAQLNQLLDRIAERPDTAAPRE